MTITNGYATLQDLLDWMGVSDQDDADAMEIAINAASRAIDEYCHRRFYADSAVSDIVYRADDPCRLYVRDFQTLTGLIVKTDDGNTGTYGTTWTVTTDYVAKVGTKNRTDAPYTVIEAVGGRYFPTSGRRDRVQVTAKYGWATVPSEVVEATLIKAARLFRRKDSPEGLAGGEQFGVVRLSKYEDPDACLLLNPLVRASEAALIL